MKYLATVAELDDLIEEYALLKIGSADVVCFTDVCPYPIEVGKQYEVLLSLVVFDDYHVTECMEYEGSKILNDKKNFRSRLIGRLQADKLIVGALEFQDDSFLSDYSDFNEKFVMVDVDRISAEFL